jgi:5-methylcytosine-specific restriction enzyme subunit McrC
MSEDAVSISLSEWQTLSPTNCDRLAGLYLDSSSGSHRVADALNSSRMLRLTELKSGLEISSRSHVGRIRVGNVNITILPKLKAVPLLRLLRYAYGFRRLELISDSTHSVDQCGFEDLLISQLNAETQELISRGLQRSYVRQDERLASPRGRINIDRLALDGGTVTATLPCHHFPRLEDTFLNQVLLAGLRLAGSVASLLDLRRESRRLASLMEEQVSRVSLNAAILDQAARKQTRLSTAYIPAFSIIRLLVESRGIVLEGRAQTTTLPGFLFDMNLFFQSLLSRFLKENLVDCSVRDEHGLKGMMRYNPKHNPQRKQSPTPRPDYAIIRQGQLVTLLDAKYRDLWEKSLPREMLYQLVVYAISHRQQLQSSILYPTTNPLATEARIDVTDPVFGNHLGQVCLRPVNLTKIEELVSANTADARRRRETLAKNLAFGNRA